jgi:hypothetical protein
MVHRYRLSNSPKLYDRKAVEINGTKFFKDRWLYSASPLNIKGFEDIVVEESASTKDEFEKIDQQRREAKQKAMLEKGRQAAQVKQKKIEEKIEEMTEEQLESKSKAKLIEYCKRLGFKDDEIEGLKKDQLVDMILLDREVSEDV